MKASGHLLRACQIEFAEKCAFDAIVEKMITITGTEKQTHRNSNTVTVIINRTIVTCGHELTQKKLFEKFSTPRRC